MSKKFAADEILPHLYLGSYFAAKDKQGLIDHGITHIVSMPVGVNRLFTQEFSYLKFKTYDNARQDLISYFDVVSDFIELAIKNNGTVLVHCMKGKSRSATMVAAYILRTQRLPIDEIVKMIKSKRPVAGPNRGFFAQLKIYEELLKQNASPREVHEAAEKSGAQYLRKTAELVFSTPSNAGHEQSKPVQTEMDTGQLQSIIANVKTIVETHVQTRNILVRVYDGCQHNARALLYIFKYR